MSPQMRFPSDNPKFCFCVAKIAKRSAKQWPNGLANKDGPDSWKISKSSRTWQTSGSVTCKEKPTLWKLSRLCGIPSQNSQCTVEEIASWMLLIELKRFWSNSNTLDQTLWIERFGSNSDTFDQTLWIKCFGSNALDQTLWIKRFGSNALDQTLSIERCQSNAFDRTLLIKLLIKCFRKLHCALLHLCSFRKEATLKCIQFGVLNWMCHSLSFDFD